MNPILNRKVANLFTNIYYLYKYKLSFAILYKIVDKTGDLLEVDVAMKYITYNQLSNFEVLLKKVVPLHEISTTINVVL